MLSKTVQVVVSDDATAPTTTAQRTGTGPVDVTLSATDGAGGTGVEWTEYRIDGGDWTRNTNSGNANPFVTTFRVTGNGEHTVDFRSRDRAGNVEDPPGTLTFTIGTGGGGGSCLPQSDEFDGSALGAKWTVLRPAGGGPTVTGGKPRPADPPGRLHRQRPARVQHAAAGRAERRVDRDDEARHELDRRQRRAGGPRDLEVREPEHLQQDRRDPVGRRQRPVRAHRHAERLGQPADPAEHHACARRPAARSGAAARPLRRDEGDRRVLAPTRARTGR